MNTFHFRAYVRRTFLRNLAAQISLLDPDTARCEAWTLLEQWRPRGATAVVYWPHGKSQEKRFVGHAEMREPWIVLNPMINFGRPSIRGTRITAAFIQERHAAGESARLLADDYDLPVAAIRAAIRYKKGRERDETKRRCQTDPSSDNHLGR